MFVLVSVNENIVADYTVPRDKKRQSLLCGRPSCMEQSTSSSSWSW